MSTTTVPRADSPGKFLAGLPVGSYVHVDQLPGTSSAAKNAASRAATRGDLVGLRRGLYYKGKRTRYGVLAPPAEDVALEVLGRKGVGPTGVWAAHVLNLTTQLPAVPELVTSGPIPTGVPGVLLHKRNSVARRDLNYAEIAVLEVLRDWNYTTEANWDGVVAAVRERVQGRQVRPNKLAAAAAGERKPRVRARLRDLLAALDRATALSGDR